MQYINIKVGTKVRPLCEQVLSDVNINSLGEIISIKSADRYRRDFYVTIRWDNGRESFLNALFFSKTIVIVDDEMIA